MSSGSLTSCCRIDDYRIKKGAKKRISLSYTIIATIHLPLSEAPAGGRMVWVGSIMRLKGLVTDRPLAGEKEVALLLRRSMHQKREYFV